MMEEMRNETKRTEKPETAKRMLLDGLPAEKTALYTDLPMDEVKALAQALLS